MDDPGARRDDAEIVQTLFSPADKAVALRIAAKIKLQVIFQRRGGGIAFDYYRVIDGQHRRNARVNRRGVTAQLGGEIAHRREISQRWQTGSVMEHQPIGKELHLAFVRRSGQHQQKPRQCVRRTQGDVFQQHAQAERQGLQLLQGQQPCEIHKMIVLMINHQF